MWIAGRVFSSGMLAATLSLALQPLPAQRSRQPYSGRDTWYESLLKRLNPSDFDYGAWLEQRRRAFLEATVQELYFWYGFAATAGLLVLLAAYAKLCLDHRRSLRVAEEMMADLYSHDLCSRRAAREAIEKYNRHIEECNRAAESADSGGGRPGWGRSEAESLRAELERGATQLEASTQERNKLQEELRQKSLVVADLSRRLDALSKKFDGVRSSGGRLREASPDGGDDAKLVDHINRLQEELYAERQKNKRLKGA
jgi:hypothetical protein